MPCVGTPGTRAVRSFPPVGVAVATALLAALLLAAVAPGLLSGSEPDIVNVDHVLQPPGPDHWFGTDQYGRDVFSRVVHGTRTSVAVGLAATFLGLTVGCALGAIAGYVGGAVDGIISWLIDVLLSFPALLLALSIIAALGTGSVKAAIAIGIALVPVYARLLRSEVLSIRQRTYVEAGRAAGSSEMSILARHVLPNAAGPVAVLTTISFGGVMIAASTLSYLGLGPQPPSPEWGTMLTDGQQYIDRAWWIPTFPGLTLLAAVLALNVLGQHLRGRHDRGSR